MNTDTGRVAEWRRREPIKYKAQKNRELDRRKIRTQVLREYAHDLTATTTKENK